MLISDTVIELFLDVTIALGELVTNDSLGTVMKYLVEDVLDYRIPLDKVHIFIQ